MSEYIENLQTSTGLAVASLPNVINRACRMIDTYTGRRFYSSTAAETKYFDGPRWHRDVYSPTPGLSYWYGSQRWMPPLDIATSSNITLSLAVGTADAANGTYTSIDARDFSLEPMDRRDGWPGLYLQMSDEPVGTYSTASFSWFSPGLGTIKLAAIFGWPSTSGIGTTSGSGVPADIVECAIELSVRLWRARDAGFSDVIGIDQMGTATVSKFMPQSVRMILDQYRRLEYS